MFGNSRLLALANRGDAPQSGRPEMPSCGFGDFWIEANFPTDVAAPARRSEHT